MAKKAVMARACKLFISTSDDGGVYDMGSDESGDISRKESIHKEIEAGSSAELVDFDESEEENKQDGVMEKEPESPPTKEKEEPEHIKEGQTAMPGF